MPLSMYVRTWSSDYKSEEEKGGKCRYYTAHNETIMTVSKRDPLLPYRY